MTRRELFTWAVERLRERSPEARLDTVRIFEHVLSLRAEDIIAHDHTPVDASAQLRIREFVDRRRRGEPVAYLCGETYFYGRRFFVDRRVLIPRPDTELLVATVLMYLNETRHDPRVRIADVGTGSGAIAVTLACEVPNAECTAIDLSEGALDVAHKNAQAYEVTARLRFCRSDLFMDISSDMQFDVIAANLPYLRSSEIPVDLDPISFEPRMALDGGEDGMDLYRRLFMQIKGHLASRACVALEAAPPTMPELRRLAMRVFSQAQVSILNDYGDRERLCLIRFC